MSTRPEHHVAERRFRDLLRAAGVPEPDEVAHWRDAIVFGWRASKAVVVLDLDDDPAAALDGGLSAAAGAR